MKSLNDAFKLSNEDSRKTAAPVDRSAKSVIFSKDFCMNDLSGFTNFFSC